MKNIGFLNSEFFIQYLVKKPTILNEKCKKNKSIDFEKKLQKYCIYSRTRKYYNETDQTSKTSHAPGLTGLAYSYSPAVTLPIT